MDNELDKKNLPVNLILVNYGDQTSMAIQCLDAVFKFHPELKSRTIIIDNNSRNNGAKQLKQRYPEARIIPSKKNLGLGIAINWGVYNASEKYLLYLNNDILIKNEITIPEMVRYLEENNEVALLGPKLINKDGSIQFSCRKFPTIRFIVYRRTVFGESYFAKKYMDNLMMTDFDHESIKEVDWIFGAAMMIRAKAMRDIGMMDERFFLYFEDVDLCRRFWEGGYKVVYYPKVSMIHYHQRESAVSTGLFNSLTNKLTRIHILSGLKYFFKYSRADRDIRTSTLQAIRSRKHELEQLKHQKL